MKDYCEKLNNKVEVLMDEYPFCEHCGSGGEYGPEPYDFIFRIDKNITWCESCADCSGDLENISEKTFIRLRKIRTKLKKEYYKKCLKELDGR